jgi:hypothetical protein
MDHPSVLLAVGLPVRFQPAAGLPVRFQPADGGSAALPRTGQHLLAGQAASTEPGLLPPPLTAR